MLKKFVFSVTAFSIAFMAACSDDSAGGSLAGGTIDPNSIAEISSSSEISSSAVAPDEDVGGGKDVPPVELSSSSNIADIVIESSSSIEIIVVESSSSIVDSKIGRAHV